MRHPLLLALLAGLTLAACSSSDDGAGDGSSALSGPGGAGGSGGSAGGEAAGASGSASAGAAGAAAGSGGGAAAGGSSAGGAAGAGPSAACDPLAAVTRAVSFAASEVVAAGTAADGTSYVLVDQPSLRLFASKGSKLVEVVVLGSGQGQDGGKMFWMVSFDDPSGEMVTVAVQDDGTGKKMGLAKGKLPGKTFEVGSTGEVLSPVDAATVAAMPAETTDTFHLELVASLPDGREVVVTAPDHAQSHDGFRAFLGLPSSMAERTIVNVARTLGIPTTTIIQMTVDGSSATLTWVDTQGSLELPSGKLSLSVVSPPALPQGAAFLCK